MGEGQDSVRIDWLPDPVPEDAVPLRARRGLGRTVKLYLYKLVGWREPSLGLHRARFVAGDQARVPAGPEERAHRVLGGEVRYRAVRKGDLDAGQQIALFVHGFSSDTHWMVSGLGEFLSGQGLAYDRVLAFNYESFNTGIAENGQRLANALREAGLSSGDSIHVDVFAHSMGTLVTRAMVEMWGGDDLVDRCFLAGPPNQGTRLAEARRLVPWIGTVLLNNVQPTPPAAVASWLLKRLSDDAVGVEDLRPGSDFLARLNGSTQLGRVPYYLLAGRNEIPAEAAGAWARFQQHMSRALDTGLDLLFEGDHDLVIDVQSMRTIRNGHYAQELLRTRIVPCNHFAYFVDPTAQSQLVAWLGGGG